jgi:hypothetical protein
MLARRDEKAGVGTMTLIVQVVGAGIADVRVDAATRELLREIREDADPQARLVTGEAAPGSKGDLVSLGQIALALVTGGAVGKLIESLFGFLGRNRKLQFELTNADGEKLTINMDFVGKHGIDQATKIAEGFLAKGN